ncbi:hypothetical protein THAOC_29589 [Thalassiosira oceanica]|uniref:CTCHY-type domain-containing protein n=1 Tax=Thalassiosira oceanica TaxID=159749 RepID=K0RG51_THAOC|nr:hypothetical protein THAOC_29589 [Thalassiosira oceanica]|eukprot:EJK51254.1 hypothetical protein THAOC_29589 [Thalassiosira oceanica]
MMDDHPQDRRGSTVSVSEEQAKERRASIRDILKDPRLSQLEKRKSVQYLMDGRRRADFEDSEEDSSSSVGARGCTSLPGSRRSSSLGASSLTITAGLTNLGVDGAAASVSEESLLGGDGAVDALPKRCVLSAPPCEHYERNCHIFEGQADPEETEPSETGFIIEAMTTVESKPTTNFQRSSSILTDFEDEAHHEIDRFSITEVICRVCYTRQSSKTHCHVCNLWMSVGDEPYHCVKCGFCRVGGRENFRHCDDCGICIDANNFDDHNCKWQVHEQLPCLPWRPILQQVGEPRDALRACDPLALLQAIDNARYPLSRYDLTWAEMAMGIALQPVPPDMTRLVDILCIDCEERSANQRWHFLGVQCHSCNSFNTLSRAALSWMLYEQELTYAGTIACLGMWRRCAGNQRR